MSYIENFTNKQDVADQFGQGEEDKARILETLNSSKVLLAWYGYGSYEGSALVVYENNGKLYSVDGSHCSCFGLEGQWDPCETNVNLLRLRDLSGSYYDGSAEANSELAKVIESYES